MKRTLRIKRIYPHPVNRVWRALTDSEAIAAWLMPNDFEPRVGHAFTLTAEPGPGFDGIVHCEVRSIDAPRKMVWSWRGGPVDTTVTFALEPHGEGTQLCVTQEGFEGLGAVLVSYILGAGSRRIYGKYLPRVLESMAREEGVPPAPEECDEGGFWRVLARIFAPILRRAERKENGA